MDEGLIERWNAVVKPNDDVYNLGDVFMSGGETWAGQILDRLNGRHHLIYGNHDQLIKKSSHLQSRFHSIKDYAEVKINKRKIVMFHFPLVTWNKGHHGAWHLHGHCHNSLPPTSTRVDVGIDTTAITGQAEHRPYSYEELVEYFKDKVYVPIDHHGDM